MTMHLPHPPVLRAARVADAAKWLHSIFADGWGARELGHLVDLKDQIKLAAELLDYQRGGPLSPIAQALVGYANTQIGINSDELTDALAKLIDTPAVDARTPRLLRPEDVKIEIDGVPITIGKSVEIEGTMSDFGEDYEMDDPNREDQWTPIDPKHYLDDVVYDDRVFGDAPKKAPPPPPPSFVPPAASSPVAVLTDAQLMAALKRMQELKASKGYFTTKAWLDPESTTPLPLPFARMLYKTILSMIRALVGNTAPSSLSKTLAPAKDVYIVKGSTRAVRVVATPRVLTALGWRPNMPMTAAPFGYANAEVMETNPVVAIHKASDSAGRYQHHPWAVSIELTTIEYGALPPFGSDERDSPTRFAATYDEAVKKWRESMGTDASTAPSAVQSNPPIDIRYKPGAPWQAKLALLGWERLLDAHAAQAGRIELDRIADQALLCLCDASNEWKTIAVMERSQQLGRYSAFYGFAPPTVWPNGSRFIEVPLEPVLASGT